jgi:hypothetical protein
MGINHINIQICNSTQEAPNYNTNGQGIKPANLDTAIIVKNGTIEGNPTVDLQFTDKDGNRYIAMITANLLKSICIAAGVAKP